MAREGNTRRAKDRHRTTGDGEEYLYHLGVAGMQKVRAGRMAKRVAKMELKARGYGYPNPRILEVYQIIKSGLNELESLLGELPKGWKPIPGSVGTVAFIQGMSVIIKDNVLSKYEGLLDHPEKPLTVRTVKAGRIFCEGRNGREKMILAVPRSHLEPAGGTH
jgi:hypothetical protein